MNILSRELSPDHNTNMSTNLRRIGLSAAAGVSAIAFATDNGPREAASMSLMKMLVADDRSVKECDEKKKVVVVGGGVCGLSTAWEGFHLVQSSKPS